jgi:Sulfotransferase domain
MPLAVIGAGQGRTGTTSLKFALEKLGFGPCYHGGEQVYGRRSPGWRLWLRAFNCEPFDWDDLFSGHRSTLDSPSCLFYRELAAKYPSAKVILTLREPNAWFESVRGTFLSEQAIKKCRETLNPDEFELFEKEHFDVFGPQLDRDSVIAAYERHNAEVRRSITPDRLLVYEVTQGWKPLCAFLHVPRPTSPFPCANSRTEMQRVCGRVTRN